MASMRSTVLACLLTITAAPSDGADFDFDRYEDTTLEAILQRTRAFDHHDDGQSVLTPPLSLHFKARIESMPKACPDKLPLMYMRAVGVVEQPSMKWCMGLRGAGDVVVSAWVQDSVAPFVAQEYQLGDELELWAVWLFVNASDRKPYFVVNAIGPGGRTPGIVAPVAGPLPAGDYAFTHRFAEQSEIPGSAVTIRIDGDHITVRNGGALPAFPRGVIAEGRLMWHVASGQWIIGKSPEDRSAPEVGGCSEGPEVVDLDARIYWTC